MRLGIWEILLIIVLVLIVFGGSKLAGVGKSLGRGIKEFKEEVHTDDAEKETVNASSAESDGTAKDNETVKQG